MGTNLWVPSLIFFRCALLWFLWLPKSIGIGVCCRNANMFLEREMLSACWQTRGDQARLSSLHIHTCTHHAFQINSDLLLSLKNAECNTQIWQVKRLQRGSHTEASPILWPWKSSLNILKMMRGERTEECSTSCLNLNNVMHLFHAALHPAVCGNVCQQKNYWQLIISALYSCNAHLSWMCFLSVLTVVGSVRVIRRFVSCLMILRQLLFSEGRFFLIYLCHADFFSCDSEAAVPCHSLSASLRNLCNQL